VELRWQFDDQIPVSAMTVERAVDVVGPWLALQVEVRSDGEESVALDRGVTPGQSYFYRLRIAWAGGEAGVYGPVSARAEAAITRAELGRIGPTPNGGQQVRIEYSVVQEGPVRLGVVDLQGRLVAELRTGEQAPGVYEAIWNPRADVRSGIYFVLCQTADRTSSRRIVVTN